MTQTTPHGAATASATRLGRAAARDRGIHLPSAPVRVVHLGAGAFHRSHQAWYLAHAAPEWGIAAFTGRRPTAAEHLTAQDGLYTLITRGAAADGHEIVGSIVEAHAASAETRFGELVTAPTTALVTLTITEAGYHLDRRGALDLADPDVAHDLVALRSSHDDGTPLRTPLARLARALRARTRVGSDPLAVMPCDNLPSNGSLAESALRAIFAEVGWHEPEAAFVTTSVDRITPRTTEADIAALASATGWWDEAAVVAEPFADWTICGEFPAGSPDWASAGIARVEAIEPYEQRKLLLLNGGHLALAFAGMLEGATTVAQAVDTRRARGLLERFWTDAAQVLGSDVDSATYCAALASRFANPRIEHRLDQVAVDTVTKLRVRVVPVLEREIAAGREADGAAGILSAWAACARRGLLDDVDDLPAAVAALCVGAAPSVDERIRRAVEAHPDTAKESR